MKQPREDDDEVAAQNPLPPSPWLSEVPSPPSPWATAGAEGPTDARSAPATPSADPGGSWAEAPGAGGPDPSGPGATGTGRGGAGTDTADRGGPARDTTAPWGDAVKPPSLRRPKPEPVKPKVPPLLIPIAAGVAVVALIVAVLLAGGDDSAEPPAPSPSPSAYSPPPNAIPVASGVSVVPVDGWSVLAQETQGKNLVTYAPNKEARAFFWVRQREGVTAREYLLRIVEGETQGETTQLGKEGNPPCPKDVLVACATITYTSTVKGVKVRGFVETYQRKDGVVTAIDFRTRVDFADKAEVDAAIMKRSVIDSL